MEINSNLCKVF